MKSPRKTIVFRLLLALCLLALCPTIGFADVTFTATSASVNGMNDDENYTKAFDGNTNNKWCGNITNGTPVYVEFESSDLITLTGYYLYTGNDINFGDGNRNPKSWKLYAKLNQSDAWSQISNVDEGHLPYECSTKSQDYDIDADAKSKPYQYFRYEFSSIEQDNGAVFEIGEIVLKYNVYSAAFDASDVEGEVATEWGSRSGRVTAVKPVTINECTYTLYQDYTYKVNPNLTRTIRGLSCVVTSSTATGTLSLPSTVSFNINNAAVDVKVAAIAEKAFYNSLTELTVPPSVEIIECCGITDRLNNGDDKNAKLEKLNFDPGSFSLYLYGCNQDYGCLGFNTALKNVKIGRPLEYACPYNNGIFEGNTSSSMSVTFDDNVKTIPARIFYGCKFIQLALPASLTVIPASMCEKCSNLQNTVIIPANITSIGDKAFAECSNVVSYTLQPSTAPTVGTGTFSGIDNYTITTPNAPVGLYLVDGTNWMEYEDHFVKLSIDNGVKHEHSAPTMYAFGYSQDCWEDLDTHKFYADKYYSIEIDPFRVILYPKFEQDPVISTDENCDKIEDTTIDGKLFNWGIKTEYTEHGDIHTAKADFKVMHNNATNARLLWYKDPDHASCQWGHFQIKVYVNNEVIYTKEQGNEDVGGFFSVPLTGLKENDIVSFEVSKPTGADWYYQGGKVTIAATLEYLLIPDVNVTAHKDNETNAYYTTFYYGESAYQMPEGTTAYTASMNNDKTKLLLAPIEGNIIPAGEAVIIKSTTANMTFVGTDSSLEKNLENILLGTDTGMTAPSNCYILTTGQNGMGFYKYSGNLSAHKAYLALSSQARGFSFVFTDDEPTGISSTPMETAEETSIYNLKGIRLNSLQKGINIVNGKKLFIK